MSPATAFHDALSRALAEWAIPFDLNQFARLWAHFQKMIEVNLTCNLTRIINPEEAATLHYADSLALLPWAATIDQRAIRVLDLGTGAGFPAVPLAVMKPDWLVTAIDATAKKAAFVREVAADIGLKNLNCEQGHGDHWRTDVKFDVVASRALGSLGDCLESGARFLRRGGYIVSYKTPRMSSTERAEAERVTRQLGLVKEAAFEYTLSARGETHHRLLDIRRKAR